MKRASTFDRHSLTVLLLVARVMGELAGLVTGMYLLATSPLPGVMVMLASMVLL